MSRKEKMYHYIYKTIDTRNENFYIGMHSTNNLNDGYIGSGIRIRKLKYRYGKNILKLEILEFLPDRKSLAKKEIEIVNFDLLKDEKCMNLRIGGEGGFKDEKHKRKFINAGKKNILKSKIKRQKVLTKKRENKAWLDNVNKKVSASLIEHYKTNDGTFLNKKHSEETIEKMRKPKNNGINNSQFGSCWITNGKENKKIRKEENLPNGWKLGRIIILSSEGDIRIKQ